MLPEEMLESVRCRRISSNWHNEWKWDILPWYREKVFHCEGSQALEQVAQRSFEVPSLEVLQTWGHPVCSGTDPALSRGEIGDVLRSLPARAVAQLTMRDEGVQEEKSSTCYLFVWSLVCLPLQNITLFLFSFFLFSLQSSNNTSLSRRSLLWVILESS